MHVPLEVVLLVQFYEERVLAILILNSSLIPLRPMARLKAPLHKLCCRPPPKNLSSELNAYHHSPVFRDSMFFFQPFPRSLWWPSLALPDATTSSAAPIVIAPIDSVVTSGIQLAQYNRLVWIRLSDSSFPPVTRAGYQLSFACTELICARKLLSY